MLTEVKCKNAKPMAKSYKLADSGGLYLEVTPSGRKYFRWKFRFAGKEKRLALGVWPELGLKDARLKRDEARLLLASGKDPVALRHQEKRARRLAAANSFEAVALEWLDTIKPSWTPDHHAYTLRRFQRYVFPEFGHIPITEVDAPLLLDMARKIERGGTIETAHKVVRACGQVFRFGIAAGRCRSNPAADLKGALKARPPVKHQAAVTFSDLPELLRKVSRYFEDGHGDLLTQLALELMLLTFVRTTELRGARWSEFDLEERVWLVPAERMKAGRPHWVPLSDQAMVVLTRLRDISGGYELVFPGRNPLRAMSKNTVLFALYRLGYRGRMTGHGVRALASTWLNEAGFDPDVIEKALAHEEKDRVRAAYHRAEYRNERRRLAQAWADALDGFRASAGQTGAEIVPIHQRSRRLGHCSQSKN